MAKLVLKTLIIVVALAGVAIVVVWGTLVYPRRHLGRQIDDLERMKLLRVALAEYEEHHGQFPPELPGVTPFLADGVLDRWSGFVDTWGNDFRYQSENSSYVLVALGRDGATEYTDYWSLRDAGDEENICGDLTRDQVLSDRGWNRYCGK